MVQPLVLIVYERLLPGGQLVQRLNDLSFRVHNVPDPAQLVELSETQKPLLVIADLELQPTRVAAAIRALKNKAETAHIPIIAFAGPGQNQLLDQGREAGATLAVTDSAILLHLDQFLDQALQVE